MQQQEPWRSGRRLGVLGGMGPLAGAHFMLRLTLLAPALRDQEHVPAVLWSDPRVPERTRPEGEGPDPLPWMLHGIAALRAAGCGAIAIPCNTAHRWFDAMRDAAGCPVLHIVDAAIAELRGRLAPPGPVGLIATAATLRFRLYQERLERAGFACVVPDEALMEGAVAPAIAAVKANRPQDGSPLLAECVRALAGRGAAAIVLGCTELPLALAAGPDPATGTPLIDSVDALARAAIGWALGKEAT